MNSFRLIKGSIFSDQRGELSFFNELHLNEVVRFYRITPSSTEIVRAWQGHERENKWFYCNSGTFVINIVKIDNFINPSNDILPKRIILDSQEPAVLQISGGYATGLKSLDDNSSLMVFSNFTLEESKNDDFRYSQNTWSANW